MTGWCDLAHPWDLTLEYVKKKRVSFPEEDGSSFSQAGWAMVDGGTCLEKTFTGNTLSITVFGQELMDIYHINWCFARFLKHQNIAMGHECGLFV